MAFIVNPIAGMGGRVGLKGTDDMLEKAVEMGAKPVAPHRAIEFLNKLKTMNLQSKISIITCPGVMGETEAKKVTLKTKIVQTPTRSKTTADDTKRAVKLMIENQKVDLLVFVGGDGTARDIFDAMKNLKPVPVLGVPSGVKMYSGIFAINPLEAAEVVEAFSRGVSEIMEFEIVDANEDAIRNDNFSINLHGFLKGPFLPMRIQGSKQLSPDTLNEHENQLAIAKFIVETMKPDGTYILGPGTTVKCIADLLGVEKTLLGVDIYKDKFLIKDVNEMKIMQEVKDFQNTWIIVSPIGRQGILFGRGNQQITPELIKRIQKERIIVGATKTKIQSIEGNILRIDTGDFKTDDLLKGYIKVVTDYKEWRLMKIQ